MQYGTLSYTPAANAHGSAIVTVQVHDEGGTANGGMDTSTSQTFTITVVSVNDAPTLNPPADLSLDEDSGAQTVSLDGISAGPANEHGQTLNVAATSSNPALIPHPSVTYTSSNATGALAFTPAAGMNGSATITVTVTDNGGTDNGGIDSQVRTFVVFVGSVNNRPTLDLPADLTILEDAGAQTVNLTGIGTGATNKNDQSLTVTATSSNPAVVPNPTVGYTSPNATGSLSLTPAANANGTTTITVTVRDTGGTANGGIDVVVRAFVVTVTPINDAPDFVVGANQSVNGTAGPQQVVGWASSFVAGPADEGDQHVVGYTVISTSNAALFSVAPAVAADGTLTYTPQVGVSGTATIGLVLQDSGGTASGGVDTSAVKTFTITVAETYRVYLPIQVRGGTPDLVASTLSLLPSKTSFGTNEPVEVQVVVTNQGDGSAGPFWVDLSLNPDHPPTTANQLWNKHCTLKNCFGLAWYIDGLAPGASATLTSKNLLTGYSVWPGAFAAGTTDLYVYVDSFNPGVAAGLVAERDETNNQFHLGGLKVTGNTSAAGVQSATDLLDRPIRPK